MHTRGLAINERDRDLMELALAEARRAEKLGEIPVGAVLVSAGGDVLAKAHNLRETTHNPVGHAEVLALQAGARVLGDRILSGCTLVVTLEPCVMCAGAITAARVSRVVFGAWDEKAGASGSVYDVLRDRRLPHPPIEVVGGVMQNENERLLSAFFADRRGDRP